MAIAFVGDDADDNTSAGTSIVVPKHASIADGHVLVAFIACIGQPTITVPSGWTLAHEQDSGSYLRTWSYWKLASGEGASWQWTLASSYKNFGWVGGYSGVDTSGPISDSLSAAGVTGTSHATPSVTAPTDGWLLTMIGARHAYTGSVTTWTTGTGTDAERHDMGSAAGTQDVTGAVYDSNAVVAAGAVSRTLTSSQSVALVAAHSIALTPAATAPPSLAYVVGVPVF